MSRQDYCQNGLLECDKVSAAKRWRTVNELLHTHQNDKTRTYAENRDLVSSFSTFFVSKMIDIHAGEGGGRRLMQKLKVHL